MFSMFVWVNLPFQAPTCSIHLSAFRRRTSSPRQKSFNTGFHRYGERQRGSWCRRAVRGPSDLRQYNITNGMGR
ncbi:hypothetical protein FKM82_015318 [Ascaphus truei]